ncbi:MAG: class I SAM-dependent methyltransferase, partial [Bacteroides sp.]
KKGVVNRIYHQARKVMLNRKAALVARSLGKSVGKVLDIGTGTGYFPHTMQEKGWTVEAIEKSAQARAFAKEHFELDVKEEAELANFSAKSFDVITLWHVMEHLEHLNEMWERLHELLSDKGVLVIAVPNCASYDAEKYKEDWAAYDVPRHLWHFTPDTIQQFGVKHNFILAAQYPMPFDAFYVSMLSEKYQKKLSPFIGGICTGSLAWFSSLGKRERSSSMIYVFRKKSNGKEQK